MVKPSKPEFLQESEISDHFPIRQLSEKTGVNSVTIRAWERRYGLLKPRRTAKGHRLYNEEDVQRVMQIMHWIQQGVAVSKVKELLTQEVPQETLELSNEWRAWQIALVQAANAFNSDKIEHFYQQVFSQYPADIAIRNWILPSISELKETTLNFVEWVLIECLILRQNSLKPQHKDSPAVLIASQGGQKTLWCYLAAAILNDRGMTCRVMPCLPRPNDWLYLMQEQGFKKAVVFCEKDMNESVLTILSQNVQIQGQLALVGAGLWLRWQESSLTLPDNLSIHSDPMEGVLSFLKIH